MKIVFRLFALCALASVGLGGSFGLRAATASYPTPVDSNGNGMIDSSEIQDVVNVVTGVVFLPANKTYNINATINITTTGVSLVGEGATTVLTVAGNIEAVVISGGTFGCGVRHLKIVGGAGHAQNAIRIDTCNETFVDDVTIQNTYRGIELVNGIGPMLTNITLTGLTGDYGIKVDGTTKVDAAQLHNITGNNSAATIEWLLFGRVDGVEVQTANLTGGLRGIRCFGAVGPKYVYTNQVTIASCAAEGVLVETGNDLLINSTAINNPGGTAFRFGTGFIGGAVLTDLNVTGAAGHGVLIEGGRDIGILEPTINAPGTALPAGTGAGIKIAAGCSYVSVTDGSSVGQTYGILYDGTTTQSDSQNVKMKNVTLTGNTVPFAPSNLEGEPLSGGTPTTVIVDNADTSGVTITGTWTLSTAVAGYYGTNFLHDGNAGGGKSVRFSPNLVAGNYDVYLRWTASTNRADNVPVDVNYAGGTTTFTVNQKLNGGTWVLLGNFAFNIGTAGNVLVRDDGANGYVIADAVQFVPSGGASPAAPSNLTATPGKKKVTLNWSDNASNETGFKIERATSASGPFTQIATVTADVVTYTNSSLTTGTTYYYRVRAYNASGDSAYTSTASATPN
jgi:hypothetical protein